MWFVIGLLVGIIVGVGATAFYAVGVGINKMDERIDAGILIHKNKAYKITPIPSGTGLVDC